VSRFDPATGEFSPPALAASASNPSFLAIHPNRRFLYAVGEDSPEGTLSAFAIQPATGKLTLLNTVSSRGSAPCHLAVDHTGHYVAAANYGSGSVVVYSLEANGSLKKVTAFVQHEGSSVNPKRQKSPHAHQVLFSPDNRFLLAADLGLDQILSYRFDAASGSLTPNDSPYVKLDPGSGPRHLAFDPTGHYVYAITELGSTVVAFAYDAGHGTLQPLQTVSTLPDGYHGVNYPAEIAVAPSGKFVYGSNRGHDTIVWFTVDPATGKLSPVDQVATQGSWPRNFCIDPTGSWLVVTNQKGNNIVVFRIDPATGKLTPAGQTLSLGSPVCVSFLKLQ